MSRKTKARKQARLDHYPCGLLIFYGPRRENAIEIAAAIVKNKDAEPAPVQTWMLPNLPGPEEIGTFFKDHGVKEIFAERIHMEAA